MSYALNYVSSTNKYKNLKLTLNIAPLSVNYKYVEDTEVDETKSGIKEGEKSITKFGSTLTTDLTYNHNRYIGFTSRLKLFSNYESFLAESENRFTMALNRYLSTVLYFYLRFDDTVPIDKKDKNWGYFQYNETLSFGLNFKW
jgi:hypothetical protein